MARTAQCACARLQVTVATEPIAVAVCHCSFCQRRTGSAYSVNAVFSQEHVAVTGETRTYNGLEVDGVGTANGEDVTYHFCPTCGATVFWTFRDRATVAIAAGNFADPDFPVPTMELHAPSRLTWVQPVDGAEQFEGFRGT